MTTDADWFDVYEGEDLMQGDLLRRVPRFIPVGIETWPPPPRAEATVEVDLVDAIVLTQSCDLEQGKVDRALLAPVYEWTRLVEAQQAAGDMSFGGTKSRENLHRGYQPGLVLLRKQGSDDPSQPDLHLPWSVINLHELFLVQASILHDLAVSQGKRLRLRPGYRGYIIQAFASYFMRPDHLESTQGFLTEGKELLRGKS